MKAIVKTTGNFGLYDLGAGQDIEAGRPAVVTVTPFINMRMGLGQISTIQGDISEEANDVAFQKFLAETEGDQELAIQSYIASLPVNEAEAETEAPKD